MHHLVERAWESRLSEIENGSDMQLIRKCILIRLFEKYVLCHRLHVCPLYLTEWSHSARHRCPQWLCHVLPTHDPWGRYLCLVSCQRPGTPLNGQAQLRRSILVKWKSWFFEAGHIFLRRLYLLQLARLPHYDRPKKVISRQVRWPLPSFPWWFTTRLMLTAWQLQARGKIAFVTLNAENAKRTSSVLLWFYLRIVIGVANLLPWNLQPFSILCNLLRSDARVQRMRARRCYANKGSQSPPVILRGCMKFSPLGVQLWGNDHEIT